MMAVNMISGTSGSTPVTGAQTKPAATSGVDPMATKDTFMKLLVAQLQNQNPLNPTDGTQFVTQLAQFTSLEQSTQMRDDISAIRTNMDKYFAAPTSTQQP